MSAPPPVKKSIIDYILVSEGAKKRTQEVYIDEEGLMKIQGKKQSDHNPIMITLEYTPEKTRETVTKWNLKLHQKWPDYNKEIQKINTSKPISTYEDLHSAMIESLNKSLGKITYTRKAKPPTPNDIKPLIRQKKLTKKLFNQQCKNNGPDKKKYLEELRTIITQINTKLNEKNKQRIQKIAKQLINEGGANSKRFWNLRKKILNQDSTNSYPLIDEDNNEVTDPAEAREHIANYYETLYVAHHVKRGLMDGDVINWHWRENCV